ncbi:hypothetical protein H0H92_012851 [Tricholoma furcatifolium]|nr:hypothetical protein H0H92_012851 [Tricholoma furcatifolium]
MSLRQEYVIPKVTLSLPSTLVCSTDFPGQGGTHEDLVQRPIQVPTPKANEVLVMIHAVSLQYRDILIANGQYERDGPEDLVPCSDSAGEIMALGSEVKGWKIGDRVCANFSTDHIYGDPTDASLATSLGGPVQGVLTEYRTFPAHCLVSIPSHLSYEEASTLPCAALTAYNSLFGSIPLKAGDHVLVLGTGGVSTFGLQFGVATGAVVIATSSSSEKLEIAGKLGAKYLINYKTHPNWHEEVLKITNGRGVDHVIEVGGQGTLSRSIKSTRIGGHIHLIGIISKDDPDIAEVIFSIIRKNITLRGILIGSVAQFIDMNKLLEANPEKTRPYIDRVFSFGEAKAAYKYLAHQEHVGKVVIKPHLEIADMLYSTVQLAALVLALAPSLASAAIFPKDSHVKMLDPKGFRQAMKKNETSMIAFVAPWCGHCQRLAPEYSKAAKALHPLVPVYAVDCDAEENKRLCGEQGVKGFPTVKVFPRGSQLGSMTYESGERTASALFHWASRRVPTTVTKLGEIYDLTPWIEKSSTGNLPRALLLTKDLKTPLLWKVLGNKYKNQLDLAIHRDRWGKSSEALGLEAGGEKESKVLIFPAGSTKFVKYQGTNKLDALSTFFDSVLDGTADLSALQDPYPEKIVEEEKEAEKVPEQSKVEEEQDTEKEPEQAQGEEKEPETEPEQAKVEDEDQAEVPEPEQIVLEEPEKTVVTPPPVPLGGQCEPAEDGPGAEAPVECDPPSTTARERLADEL